MEPGQIGRGAALEGAGARRGAEAEVAADVLDDVRDGAAADVRVEVGGVQAVAQLGGEAVGAVRSLAVGWGRALDAVLDLAQDALAGGGAVPGRIGRGGVEAAREGDAAADGSGDLIEGGGEADEGGWGGGRWGELRVFGLGGGRGGVRGGLGDRRGPCLRHGLRVQEAGEVGARVNQAVQGLAVVLRVCGVGAGVVLRGGVGCGCGHERNKNIASGAVSRRAWLARFGGAAAGALPRLPRCSTATLAPFS